MEKQPTLFLEEVANIKRLKHIKNNIQRLHRKKNFLRKINLIAALLLAIKLLSL